ncbi:unnamed protein product [Callosobruchus maculatus]|uniref:Uncharacterized protein n=1 Tax=Callosobruchus maculatus TaxID=64391 RepID=A0A653BW43_CALMS|nr:unnamed protein product [Callosobruchus maculatus]
MYVLCIYKQANNNLVYNLLTMSRDSNGKKIWTPKELSKVPIGELKSIRVSIKRSNIATTGPSTDLIRGIDDPKVISQLVHCKRDYHHERCTYFTYYLRRY